MALFRIIIYILISLKILLHVIFLNVLFIYNNSNNIIYYLIFTNSIYVILYIISLYCISVNKYIDVLVKFKNVNTLFSCFIYILIMIIDKIKFIPSLYIFILLYTESIMNIIYNIVKYKNNCNRCINV